jgi:hypothetical protein
MMQPSPSAGPDVHILGARTGIVKALLGYRKNFHRIPVALPDAAYERQFIGICAADLDRLVRDLFERLRIARGYKRREITLATDSPASTLNTTDFTLDLAYALDVREPADYQITYDLHGIRDIGVFADEPLNAVFAGIFNRIAFRFPKAVAMETLIDELEAMPGGASGLLYPPDCRECLVSLPGLLGNVRLTSAQMEVIHPSATSPAELVQTFADASEILAANPILAKLIPRRGA